LGAVIELAPSLCARGALLRCSKSVPSRRARRSGFGGRPHLAKSPERSALLARPCSSVGGAFFSAPYEENIMSDVPNNGLQLRVEVSPDFEIELSLRDRQVRAPGPDEVLIRVEAAPIHPTDVSLLLGQADTSQARVGGTAREPVVKAPLPQAARSAYAARIGRSSPAGTEGAGVVVAAGANAQALVGKRVAVMAGAMYAEFATVKAAGCLVLPDDVTPAEGAACFVNPLTALGMVETMRLEGRTGLVHTAAASTLGQMLVRICQNDGVPLVNIVRKPEQAELLRGLGATHVCDTSAASFASDLNAALAATGATIAFDAIGGGGLAGQILAGMEAAAVAAGGGADRYGSTVHKQVYIYGSLDTGPTQFIRNFGMMWGMGGWLLFPFLNRLGAEGANRLRSRVIAEIKTTFASSYAAEISLSDALQPEMMSAYARKSTGGKYLIRPDKR
jgi:NADPH2:quinone reductase